MCYKNEQSHIKLGYSSIRILYACENDPFLRSLRQIQIITYWCGHLKETPVSAVTIWLECSAAGKGFQVSEANGTPSSHREGAAATVSACGFSVSLPILNICEHLKSHLTFV